MDKLGIGIIGVNEGASILSAASQSEMCDLIQICDLNEELCINRCKEFNIPSYTLNYKDMLANKDIDIIGIYTPDPLHAEHIKMALLAKKHVVCTKPLLISLDDAKELKEIQAKTGKKVFVGQSTRFFEPIKKQREDYEAGVLGELITMEASYISDARWYASRDWSKGGGFSWMYGFMIHAADLAVWYLPDIKEVYGTGYASPNTKEIGIFEPDTLKFIFKSSDGRSAFVSGTYCTRTIRTEEEQQITCTLRGTKGTTRAGYPKLAYFTDVREVEPPKTEFVEEVEATEYRYDDMSEYFFRFGGLKYHAGEYQNYLEYFIACIKEDKVAKPDLEEGINTIAVMNAMELSMKENRVVQVKEITNKYL